LLLTPREQEALLIYVAANLARTRRERGLKLNYPEAARDGRSVTEAASIGATVLSKGDVMDGIPELVSLVQIEATFPDGTKLVSCHNPIA
jgi:urease subunit gamma